MSIATGVLIAWVAFICGASCGLRLGEEKADRARRIGWGYGYGAGVVDGKHGRYNPQPPPDGRYRGRGGLVTRERVDRDEEGQ